MTEPTLRHQLAAETLGTGLLLAAIVGSGIMAARLASGNTAIALLANAIATAAALYVLITLFARISGAQFNPAVTLGAALLGEIPARTAMLYVLCQSIGGIIGVWSAHLMFGLDVLQTSSTMRTGWPLWFSEALATFGLILVIHGVRRERPAATAHAIALYILAAYWFTASTSFANPAVTIARSVSDTFAGISPWNAPAFIASQLVGLAVGLAVTRFFWPRSSQK